MSAAARPAGSAWRGIRALAALALGLLGPALSAARFSGEPEIQARPLSPEEALKSFRLDPGLRIELVAAEPLVTDPVDIAFDERGRLYVVECNGYNRDEKLKPRSRIRLLEDVDGDGRMDRGTLFADDLDYAQGIMVMQGGVVVTTNSGILFLRDDNGDGRADQTKVLFECSTSIYTDRQMSAPRRALDNWIYVNLGLQKKELSPPGQRDRQISLTNNFRFHPGTGEFGPAAGAGQFGRGDDDWGRAFFSMNRNPGLFAVLPLPYLQRNPLAFLTKSDEDVVPAGGDGKVHPLQNFRTTSSAHAGTFTAACGAYVYRGDALGEAYANNLFVCEPTGALVTRWILEPAGPSFRARRATPGREFLASTDEWFRPVNTHSGPDGAFYVVDMYRRFLDGTRFFPDDYVAANDMGAGSDRGRIYRIVRQDQPAVRKPAALPTEPARRVALLEHRNGWHRDNAQRLLVEAGDRAVLPAVATLLRDSRLPQGRLHALWTLEGLGGLEAAHVGRALGDAEPGVVENALWLAPRFLRADAAIRRQVFALAASGSPRVRFAALLAAGDLEGEELERLLVAAARREGEDPWMRAAIFSAPTTRSGRLLAALLREPEFAAHGSPGRIELASGLAMIAAASGQAGALQPAFALLSSTQGRGESGWLTMAVLGGVADGLRRQPEPKLPRTVSALLESPPAELADSIGGIRQAATLAVAVVKDPKRPINERLAAVALLEHGPKSELSAVIPPLLHRREPAAMQQAAVALLRQADRATLTPVLYQNLGDMGSVARAGVLQFLQQNPMELMKRIKAGELNPALIDAAGRWLILNSRLDEVRAMGREIFGQTEGDRKVLVRRYATAIKNLTGSAARGHVVFTQTCAVCHRFRGEGKEVGPDITDVRIKTADMLLSDILDPNNEVDPRWEAFTIQADGGRGLVGLIASETNDALVVRGLAGTETLARSAVQSYTPLGSSLMPEGLEGTLDEQRMADLIAFLRSTHEAK
ncbi:MAG: c-type cytochrome [Opitutaceae bacterium]|nr:c-type cytochrome [Opitutaceae bacterium]